MRNEMQTYERCLLLGQFLSVGATALLSLGQVLKMFHENKLITEPIGATQKLNSRQDSLYSGRRSYFD